VHKTCQENTTQRCTALHWTICTSCRRTLMNSDEVRCLNGHASMSVCMYVRMDVCMSVCLSVCVHACMYVCMYACTYVCMYVGVCMYGCMCVCMEACPSHQLNAVYRPDKHRPQCRRGFHHLYKLCTANATNSARIQINGRQSRVASHALHHRVGESHVDVDTTKIQFLQSTMMYVGCT
jgi:hypothetical protein